MGETERFDVALVGGGPTGLTAALLLAGNGYRTALIAPDSPDDGRSVAILQSSLDILATIGVDDEISESGSPLAVMRLVDDTGRLFRAPEIAFRAAEIGLDAFGYSIHTARLVALLSERADHEDNLTVFRTGAQAISPQVDNVLIETDDDRMIEAALVVGADGKRSRCRDAAGLKLRSWQYEQTALVTTFSHSLPHDSVSTEFHTRAGPFTVVPVGEKRCGLVWVDRPAVIDSVKDAEPDVLAREIERRSHHILGRVTVEAPAKTVPMTGGYLSEPAARRTILVGEAAHYFPPIGAQGLNLGFRDCAALAGSIGMANPDPGSAESLARYVRARRLDVASRTWGVDLMNRSLLADFLPVQMARAATLGLADSITPLRGLMMRVGMAVSPIR